MAVPSLADLFEKVGFRVQNISGQDYLVKVYGDLKIGRLSDMLGRITALTNLPQVAAVSLIGNATAALADATAVAFSADNHVLKRTAGVLVSGLIDAVNIASDAVTTAKILDGSVTVAKRTECILTLTSSPSALAANTTATIAIDATRTIGAWAAIVSNRATILESGLYDFVVNFNGTSSTATDPLLIDASAVINDAGSPVSVFLGRMLRGGVAAAGIGINGTTSRRLVAGDTIVLRFSQITTGVAELMLRKVAP